ncbi:class I SAM-dependent methyltransferase [soil metagenome]
MSLKHSQIRARLQGIARTVNVMTTSPITEPPSDEQTGLFAYQVATQMSGAVTAAMIHLGDRLGLYRALAAAPRPLTAQELADAAGLVERWVREWAHNQAAAGLVRHDDGRFSLSAEAVAVLVDEQHEMCLIGMFHQLPQDLRRVEVLPDSFRTGIGRDYDDHGPEAAIGMERSFEPWMRAHLITDLIPLLDDVEQRLRAGARAADVGCGAGGVVLQLAAAFPASRFAGYDISQYALARARERLAERGLPNAEFHDPREAPMPDDGSLGLVTAFDCLHDMTDPAGIMATIRRALSDDGTWLLVDIKAYDSLAENLERNPMAAMMYGTSVITCLASSLSEPGGAGLGTLGLSAERAEAMAADAGFTRFRRLDVDHPINAFYEIRP